MSKREQNLKYLILTPLALFFVINTVFDMDATLAVIGYYIGFNWEY